VKSSFPSRLASLALDAFAFGDRAPLVPLCAAPTYIDWIRSVALTLLAALVIA
jgi:hypothetical protein